MQKIEGYDGLFEPVHAPDHTWREHYSHSNGRYIADGTVGQFDLDYPQGYYGRLEDASELLQRIYSYGNRIK